MALLPIIIAPDPRLKLIAAPVGRVDENVRQLMDDMLETMYQAPGVGLAAPQVGVLKRVIVVDASAKDAEPAPLRMANPELIEVSDEDAKYEEGCLSLPEHYAEVVRPAQVRLRYLDHENGKYIFTVLTLTLFAASYYIRRSGLLPGPKLAYIVFIGFTAIMATWIVLEVLSGPVAGTVEATT